MGRPTTRPQFATVASALAAMLDASNPARLTQWGRSGCERADLVRIMHEDNDACAICELPTFHTSLKVANVATLGHVVSPSQVPDSSGRVGYVGGNLILTCRACNDALGLALKAGQDIDLAPFVSDRAEFTLTLPTLNRFYAMPDEDGARLGYIARSARTHRDEAREARAERGLTF